MRFKLAANVFVYQKIKNCLKRTLGGLYKIYTRGRSIYMYNNINNEMLQEIPHNIEAEQAVLGAILIPNKLAILEQILDLRPDEFYRGSHKIIFETMLKLHDQSVNIDLISLTERLGKDGKLGTVGGIAYITSLANLVPTAANIRYYTDIVKDKALRRNLIQVSDKMKQLAVDGEDTTSILDEIARTSAELSKSYMNTGEIADTDNLLNRTFNEIDTAIECHAKGEMSGLDTGFTDVNNITGGLQKSDLIILGARPSMGKTALALNLACNIAFKNNPVVIFSYEMSDTQLMKRILSSIACVSNTKIRTGDLTKQERQRLEAAKENISNMKDLLKIDNSMGLTIEQLKAKARQYKATIGTKLIVIDYLQLISSAAKAENRTIEIGRISRELKRLALELDIPIIALSQLNRRNEETANKKPKLSDLRDSGAIEQDADTVILLYRESYYDENKRSTTEPIELNFAKHRNGAVDTVTLDFTPSICKFTDHEKSAAENFQDKFKNGTGVIKNEQQALL